MLKVVKWLLFTDLIFIALSIIWVIVEIILYGQRFPSSIDSVIALSISALIAAVIVLIEGERKI